MLYSNLIGSCVILINPILFNKVNNIGLIIDSTKFLDQFNYKILYFSKKKQLIRYLTSGQIEVYSNRNLLKIIR